MSVRRYWAFLTFVAVIITVSSCESPLAPGLFRWTRCGFFPEYDCAVALNEFNGVCYIAGSGGGSAVVYGYDDDGGAITERYRALYYDSYFCSLSSASGVLWAAGGRQVSGEEVPLVVRFDGSNWEEVTVPTNVKARPLNVYALGPNTCWFWGDFRMLDNDEVYLYYYDRGSWAKRFYSSWANGERFDFAFTKLGRAYIFQYGGLYDKKSYMWISDDYGVSWSKEEVTLTTPYWALVEPWDTTIAPADENVFLLARFKSSVRDPGITYWGVARRDGAPGRGVYDITFMAPKGPNFGQPNSMAFYSESLGYVAGRWTAAALRAGAWILEERPQEGLFEFGPITAGPSRFWALVDEETTTGQKHSLYSAPLY